MKQNPYVKSTHQAINNVIISEHTTSKNFLTIFVRIVMEFQALTNRINIQIIRKILNFAIDQIKVTAKSSFDRNAIF